MLRQLLVVILLSVWSVADGQVKNGFDLAGALVPANEVLSGGPPRDGIPAIDAPKFVRAGVAGFLQPTDRVLGVALNGVKKAYPVSIMNWHEIVNDTFADEPVVVSYCPLCGTGIAYSATAGGRTLRFGVSGLLYNSDMLLYDRQTQSLWSQIRKQAISGALRGERLRSVPMTHTSWEDWLQRHPDTLVLSTDTGYARDYSHSPYGGYEQSANLYFPVKMRDPRHHPKEWVLGIEIDGNFKAYPFVELEKHGAPVHDTLNGKAVVVRYDPRHRTAEAFDDSGDVLTTITSFWFAWYAFHPDTERYQAP